MKTDERGFITHFNDYRELPFSRQIQDALFAMHKHEGEEGYIVYDEYDVIKLLQMQAAELKPPIKTIEERRSRFWDACNGLCDQIDHDSLQRFFDYWTEISPTGKKMRFEKEKVFDIKKRLARWKQNNFGNGNKQQPVDRDQQLADYLKRDR